MNDISFKGRVAVVTGAGNGLGRDYALELARQGAKVVVNDLGGSPSGRGKSPAASQEVVDEIRAAGGEAVANTDSVATRTGGEAVIQTALDTWGRLDVLISNAGFLRNNRFEDLTDDDIDPILDVHLKAAFYVGQPAYRAMRAVGYGRMLFTGSASGMFGHAWQANYAAAKAAMLGLSNVIALEGSAYGITSNVFLPTAASRLMGEMSPGFMEIPEFARIVSATDFSLAGGRVAPQFNTPLALYLVSESCTATQGVYSANCGRYARVRICASEGWVSPSSDVPPTIADIAAHFEEISKLGNYSEPRTPHEEYSEAMKTAHRQGVLP